MNNCLVTKYKSPSQNEGLPIFDTLRFNLVHLEGEPSNLKTVSWTNFPFKEDTTLNIGPDFKFAGIQNNSYKGWFDRNSDNPYVDIKSVYNLEGILCYLKSGEYITGAESLKYVKNFRKVRFFYESDEQIQLILNLVLNLPQLKGYTIFKDGNINNDSIDTEKLANFKNLLYGYVCGDITKAPTSLESLGLSVHYKQYGDLYTWITNCINAGRTTGIVECGFWPRGQFVSNILYKGESINTVINLKGLKETEFFYLSWDENGEVTFYLNAPDGFIIPNWDTI